MKKISVIGLGFVGLPTFLILSNIKKNNKYIYEVEGIEKHNSNGLLIKKNFENNHNWINSSDKNFNKFFEKAAKRKEIKIKTNLDSISESKIIIVSINFDFNSESKNHFKNLKMISSNIAKKINKKTLVIFETTLPPGTTDNVIIPIFKETLKKRKIKIKDIFFCYSFERVMPGENYINSIVSNYRCYSGINKESKMMCKKFLQTFIHYKKYRLTELDKIIECETAKVLENSYRASNIALIDEWTKASEVLNINLNKVIESIKLRNTHSNIMWPGLGVGGYCLTKDPSFIKFSLIKYYKKKIIFPFISSTAKINKGMVNTSVNLIKKKVKNLKKKNVLICGVSYKENTSDTRFSPSIDLIKKIKNKCAKISVLDPYHQSEINELKKINFVRTLNKNFDILIFCVKHKEFDKISFNKISFSKKTKVFDLNRVLTNKQKKVLNAKKIEIYEIGVN